MNRIVITLLLFISVSSSSFAQERNGEGREKMRNRIEAQKISYITQKLDLSPQEAQNFWPIYNELEKKKHENRRKAKVLFKRLYHEKDTIAEAELIKISDQLIDIKLEDAQLDKKYHAEFKKILPAKKILDLYHTEKQFRGMLLRQIKERGRRQHSK